MIEERAKTNTIVKRIKKMLFNYDLAVAYVQGEIKIREANMRLYKGDTKKISKRKFVLSKVEKERYEIFLEEIAVAESSNVDYDRSEWKHWSGTPGRSCWNTREEVLHRDAEEGTVLYVDKQMNSTTNYEEACAIGSKVEDEKGKIKIVNTVNDDWLTAIAKISPKTLNILEKRLLN